MAGVIQDGAKGRSPTLAKRIRSLVNFIGGYAMFMFDPRDEESLREIKDRWEEKAQIKLNRF